MRLLAILLIPAFVGLVVGQQNGRFGGTNGQGGGMRDQATFAGGSSRRGQGQGQGFQGQQGHYYPNPQVAGQFGGTNGQGTNGNGGMKDQASFAGGSSRKGTGQGYPGQGYQGQGYQGQGAQGQTGQGQVNYGNQGRAPNAGGSSRGSQVPNLAPVQPGPIVNHVAHANAGAGPDPSQTGGSSRGLDVALGPVQTNVVDRVNMVNSGGAPPPGQGNSGEAFYDYGAGAGGAGGANGAPVVQPHPQGGAGRGTNSRVYNAAGGSSGLKGPAFAAPADKAGKGAPLGGALLTAFEQDPAASTGTAAVGSTVAGVVVAVLVLVGIVAVAAVFLVRQRTSRMAIANV